MEHYTEKSNYDTRYSNQFGDQDRRKRNRSESSSEHRHVRPRRGGNRGNRQDNKSQRMECRMVMTKTDVAMLIGKGGKTIQRISKESNAWVNFASPLPGSMQQLGTFKGSIENVKKAIELMTQEMERGGELGRRPGSDDNNHTDKRPVTLNLLIPESQIGRIIGKKGATVKKFQEESGATISIAHEQQQSTIFTGPEQVVRITGSSDAVHAAASTIIETVDFSAAPTSINNSHSASSLHSFRGMDMDITASQQARLYEYYAQLNHPYLQQLPDPYMAQGSATPANFQQMSQASQVSITGRTQRGFSAKMIVGRKIVGAVIGKSGSGVKKIRQDSEAFVHFEQNEISTAYGPSTQVATVGGAVEGVITAIKMVTARIGEIHAEISGKRESDRKDRLKCELIVPSAHIGWLIGRQGIKIKETIEASNADISVSNQKWFVAGVEENMVTIEGTTHAIGIAVGRIINQLNERGTSSEQGRQRQRILV